ncbi:MAG: hypothetical protein ACREAW_04880 [Nitrososphaera sp.]
MGEDSTTRKDVRTGIVLTAENHAFLSASGNMSKAANEIVSKVRLGQFNVDKKEDAKFNCIFHLVTLNGADIKCPPRMEHPEIFCGDKNVGNLTSHACSKCMLRYEHKKLIDLRVRYPKNFEKLDDIEEQTPTTATASEQIQSKQLLKSAPPPAPKRTRYEEVTAKRVVCDTCRAVYSSYLEDDAAVDRLVESFEQHLSAMHGSRPFTDNEVQQFRWLRRRVL